MMPSKKQTGSKKPVEKAPPKVEGMPCHIWLLITLVLVVMLIVISGWAQATFDDVEYWGRVPLDIYTGILFLAAALFIPITMMFRKAYQQRQG
jgi:hypothetical protein